VGRNLTKHFNTDQEASIYALWEASGAFKPSGRGRPYFIPMPPPNITGHLHAGHAMFTTIQDILIRYHRMAGYNTLWLPGTDHAGLATQSKLDAEMISLGLDPSGPDFHPFAEQYKQCIGNTITEQLRRTGASCDWSRYRFTLDDDYSTAVRTAFDMCRDDIYKDGDQWYLDMREPARTLIDHITAGDLKIVPEHSTKTLLHFLENIEPWCISRQIRWGHPIPIEGDTDVLDTWFSSALWPFAALGWPNLTNDLMTFYPASLIETADDILFFWCARMLMMGIKITGRLPFKTIYLHGLIRDENGEKLSKTLGNGIDPIEIIDEYGCDAMRMALAEAATPGKDIRLWDEKFASAKSLRIKLWNASKFALRFYDDSPISRTNLYADDRDLLNRIEESKKLIANHIESFEIHLAAQEARRFLYDDLCSWYIEASKERLYAGQKGAIYTISTGLRETLIMLHPFMPFVSEAIWQSFRSDMLITKKWDDNQW